MMRRILYSGMIFFWLPAFLGAQCGILDSFYIPDESSENFILEVNGLSNDDLSDPNQGVCGVTLHFEHDGIGDWEVLLTSPSGQQVRLVGPSGLFGQTNGSSWDVTFVPCGDMAAPDLGYLPTWDSDQAWGNFASFTGSYYPNVGCLEDFDLGNVNGSWTLFIRDYNELDLGLLLGFSLRFCDESGSLTCLLCTAKGGRLTHSNFKACHRDQRLDFDPGVVFPEGEADTTNYDYTYLIVRNDIIVDERIRPNLTGAPPGIYTVCGLSYQESDSTDVPQPEDMQSFSQFRDSLSSPNPPMCGELSTNCVRVEIVPIPDTVFIQDMICKGATYQIEDSSFSTPGIKYINTLSANGCDSVIVLDLEVVEPLGRLTGDSVFSCTDTIMDLFYDGEPLSELDFIEWSNASGDFTASNTLRVQASKAGLYTVRVSKRGCVKSFTRRITNSVDIPVINARGTILTCSQRQRRIRATSSITPATYVWRYNGTFFSNQQNPFVTQGGQYEVTVKDSSGCLNRATVEVTLDTISSESVAIGGSLRCAVDSFRIDLRTRNGSTYLWSGPGGFSSTSQDPWVTLAGWYTVIVSLPNGCMDTVSAQVRDDVEEIQFDFVNDTIDCANPSADLEIMSSILGTGFRWIGQMNDTLFGGSVSVSNPGFYTVRATTIDGCERDTIIEVMIDTIRPVISVFGDLELTCNRQSLDLVAQAAPSDAVISWVYPDRRVFVTDRINTRLGGTYQIVAERPNGCRTVKDITSTYGQDMPDPMTLIQPFNCSTDTASLSAQENINYQYEWSDLSNILSSDFQVFVTDTGWYYLDVTDQNTCAALYAYFVPITLDLPNSVILGADQITCVDSVLRLSPSVGVSVRSFDWTLDGRSFSSDSSILIRSGGDYIVELEFSSLCRDTIVKSIKMDTVKPMINILPYDSLDCRVQILDLAVEADQSYNYFWSLNGNLLVRDSVIAISTPGRYVLRTESTTNDCVRLDTLTVTQDTIKPKINIIGSEINCAAGKTEISVESDLSDVMIEWIGPDGFSSDLYNPLVNDTGVYRVIVTASTGCFATDTTYLKGNFVVPDISGQGGSLNCRDSSAVIVAISQTPGTEIKWFGAGGFVVDDSIATVRDTGYYVVIAKGVNGCTSKDTVYVDDQPAYPVLQNIDLEEWTCRSESILARANSMDDKDIFRWINASGLAVQGSPASITELGMLRLEVEGTNGCITTLDTIIPTDTITPRAYIHTEDIYICEHTKVRLQGTADDSTLSYDYYWWTDEGEILKDERKQQVLVNALGAYFLALTNRSNGCTDTSTYSLQETQSNFRSADIVLRDYTCLTDYNASISIEGIEGGFGSVTVSIDGEPYVSQRSYEYLLPGFYTISLRDSFGCVLDTTIEISDIEDYRFDLPKDTVINLGDEITISPELSDFIDPDDMHVLWRPNTDLDCAQCLDLIVSPLRNTTYCLQISNSSSCKAEACIEIKVNEIDRIFVPQAFTPNGDQKNDRLIIGHSPDLELVQKFIIYDRWGNLLYEKTNFLPGEEEGWDGRFGGRFLDPQVLVYYMQYRLINGVVHEQSGDITLLR